MMSSYFLDILLLLSLPSALDSWEGRMPIYWTRNLSLHTSTVTVLSNSANTVIWQLLKVHFWTSTRWDFTRTAKTLFSRGCSQGILHQKIFASPRQRNMLTSRTFYQLPTLVTCVVVLTPLFSTQSSTLSKRHILTRLHLASTKPVQAHLPSFFLPMFKFSTTYQMKNNLTFI